MSDRRPDCVYAILIRDSHVFLRSVGDGWTLPGGTFGRLADHRKHELIAQLWDQLGIEATAMWAQGAFDYRAPGDDRERFSGFYSVWDWDGEVPGDAGAWFTIEELPGLPLPPQLRILLTSLLSSQPMRTT